MRCRWQEPEPPPKFRSLDRKSLLRSAANAFWRAFSQSPASDRPRRVHKALIIKVSRAIGGFGLRRITAAILAAARDVSARAGRRDLARGRAASRGGIQHASDAFTTVREIVRVRPAAVALVEHRAPDVVGILRTSA